MFGHGISPSQKRKKYLLPRLLQTAQAPSGRRLFRAYSAYSFESHNPGRCPGVFYVTPFAVKTRASPADCQANLSGTQTPTLVFSAQALRALPERQPRRGEPSFFLRWLYDLSRTDNPEGVTIKQPRATPWVPVIQIQSSAVSAK